MPRKKKANTNKEANENLQPPKDNLSLLNKYSNYLPYIGLAIIILISIIFRSKFIGIPFERDEGAYTYLGQLLIDGKIPYIDYGVQKFPGIFYCYAFLITIFGHTLTGIQTGFVVLNIASIILIFWAAQQLFKNNIAALASALGFVFMSLNPYASGFTIQSEHLVSFFVIASIAVTLLSFKKEKWYWYLLSGILACLAMLVKPTGAFYIVGIGLMMVLHHFYQDAKNWKKIIIDGLLYSAGVFGLYAIVVAIIYSQGAFDAMWYWTVEVPKFYVNQISEEQGLQLRKFSFERISNYNIWWWYTAAAGIVGLFILRPKKYYSLALLILVIIGYATVTPGRRYYGHYWIQLMPALSLAAGAFFYAVYSFLEKKWMKNGAIAVSLLLMFVLFIQEKKAHPNYYSNPNHNILLRNVYSSNPFPEAKVIGDYIAKRTTEEDQIVVLGNEPQIYFYTNRRCPNNRFYMAHLMRDTLIFPEMHTEQMKFIHSLETTLPKYVVFFDHPISWMVGQNSDRTIFKWFDPWVNKNYNLVGFADMIGQFDTKYLWGKQINGYQPKGQYRIRLYERKKVVTKPQ